MGTGGVETQLMTPRHPEPWRCHHRPPPCKHPAPHSAVPGSPETLEGWTVNRSIHFSMTRGGQEGRATQTPTGLEKHGLGGLSPKSLCQWWGRPSPQTASFIPSPHGGSYPRPLKLGWP